MSAISVRIPDSLHQKAKELAKKENTSINHLISSALAEKISALMTEDYMNERAKKGEKKKFKTALNKVADVEPEYFDK